MDIPWLEILGYVASVVTAISLMMVSHIRLRLVNLVGSSVFALYGFLIQAYPVAALNVFIALVDLYFLLRAVRVKTLFTLLPMSAHDVYFAHFLDFHRKDIAKYFPHFSPETMSPAAPDAHGVALYLLRNMVPAGVFIARRTPGDPGSLTVELDYVTPEYRDYRTGRFLFHDSLAYFRAQGVRRIVTAAHTDSHVKYLEKVGFTLQPGSVEPTDPVFVLSVPEK